MSAVRGAVVGVGLLIAEEVLVTSRGGPAAVNGVIGTLVKAIDRFADPTIPAIPDRSKTPPKKNPKGGSAIQPPAPTQTYPTKAAAQIAADQLNFYTSGANYTVTGSGNTWRVVKGAK